MKKAIAYLLTSLLCFAIASCGGDSGGSSGIPSTPPTPTTKVAVTGVSVDKTSLSMKEGEGVEITVTVSPDNASNKNVTWKSENPAVATVSNGKITAVGAGSTTITVTTADGNKTASVKVEVSVNMLLRQKKALLALFNATGGSSWTNKEGWNTDAELKNWYGLTMGGDRNEYVTSIKLAGNNLKGTIPAGFFETMVVTRALDEASTRAEITEAILSGLKELDLSGNQLSGEIPAAIGNLTALITLNLSNNQLTGNIPESFAKLEKLTSLAIDHNNLSGSIPKAVTDSKMWGTVSSKTDLTQNGDNKLISDGTPTPTPEPTPTPTPDPTPTPTPEPTPTPTPDPGPTPGVVKVTSVALNRASMTIEANTEETLTATVGPSDASVKTVDWKSSNTSVATVDANGKVKAVAAGTTNITATAKDGSGKVATCVVTVVASSSSSHTIGEDLTNGGQEW